MNNKEISSQLKKLENKYIQQYKDVYDAINYLLQKYKQETQQKDRKRIGYKRSNE